MSGKGKSITIMEDSPLDMKDIEVEDIEVDKESKESKDAKDMDTTIGRAKEDDVEEDEVTMLEHIDRTENENEIFEAALSTYFDLKNKYEEVFNKQKDKLYKDEKNRKARRKPYINLLKNRQCIYCGKEGGTIFEEKERKYIARCGNTSKPCKLDIRIEKPYVMRTDEQLHDIRDTEQQLKLKIMKLRLDYLFEHIGNETLEKDYETLKQEQSETHELYESLLETIQKNTKNIKRDKRIQAIQLHLNQQYDRLTQLQTELKSLDDTQDERRAEIYREKTEIHNDNIYPYVEALRNLIYDDVSIHKEHIYSPSLKEVITQDMNKHKYMYYLMKEKNTILNDEIFMESGNIVALQSK